MFTNIKKDYKKFYKDNYIRSNTNHLIHMPYYIISGKNEGPIVVITSGIHGTEYPGIAANYNIYKSIPTENLRGTLIGFTQCNYKSFISKSSFINPADNKNLNYLFPGDNSGSESDLIVSYLAKIISTYANYHIDLHSGDSFEYLSPHIFYHENMYDKIVSEKSLELANAHIVKNICSSHIGTHNGNDKGNFYSAMSELGIPSIQVEVGGMGLIDQESINIHFEGVCNILKKLNMLNSKCENYPHLYFKDVYRYKSPYNGTLFMNVTPGEIVTKGKLIATIKDSFMDEPLVHIHAPEKGAIFWRLSTLSVKKGETVLSMGITI